MYMQPSAPARAPEPQVIQALPEPKQPTFEEAQARQAADEQKLIDKQAGEAVKNNNSSMAKTKRDTYVRTQGAASNYLGS